MKKHLLSILVAAIGLAMFSAQAAEGDQASAPSGAKPTKEERAAAASKRRAEMTAAQKKGEVPKISEGVQDKPPVAKGTPAERKAERAAKRAEMAKATKDGKVPVTTEAGVETKK
jgi:hypothetical protein